MPEARAGVRNKLLLKLADDDFDYIRPNLERIALKLHDKLIRPGAPIEHVYFPDSGQISLIVGGHRSDPLEVGLVGREGMTAAVLLPGDKSALTHLVQATGEGWRLTAEDYLSAQRERSAIHRLAIRVQQWTNVQACYAALSHGSYTIPERLARWLLMTHDRLDGDELPLAHEFISMMLAVRRSGVTEALHVLEDRGAIQTGRARITVLNRGILETLAGESYGPVEAEYKRLLEDDPF
jgi:CRP-like cAMP-binding protein